MYIKTRKIEITGGTLKLFASLTDVQSIDKCWEWLGYRNHNGYGLISYDHHNVRAHRYSWQAFRGDLLEGILVLHKCNNPGCVNPFHLYLGNHRDNAAQMVRDGRSSDGERKDGKEKLRVRRRYTAKHGLHWVLPVLSA